MPDGTAPAETTLGRLASRDQPASGMRAAILQTARGPFCQTSISRPEPGPSEVLIRIAASGINPLDTKIQMGEAAHAGHALPAILGLDLAGTVEALGDGVTRFRIGTKSTA